MPPPNAPRRRLHFALLGKDGKPIGPRGLPLAPKAEDEELLHVATGKHTIEHHANALEVQPWLYWAAKAGKAWPDRAEVTEDEFKAAIEAAGSVRIGG